MANRSAPFSPLTNARLTGVLYLIIIVLGIVSEVAVRGRVIVPGDAATTASNIVAAEGLLRFGFLADSLVFLCDAAVAVLLYELLKPVNRTVAMLAAAFRLTQTAVLALNLLDQHAALLLMTGSDYGSLGIASRNALAYLMLERHGHGYDLGLLFFGVHCLLLGWLIARSGFLPRTLGALMMAASLTYLGGSYIHFLAPGLAGPFAPAYVVAVVAELGLGGWLLLRGVNVERWALARGAGLEPS